MDKNSLLEEIEKELCGVIYSGHTLKPHHIVEIINKYKDEEEIEILDQQIMERSKNEISTKTTLRLERSIMDIDGERDKIKISNILKALPIMDIRNLNKYLLEIEPGINFNVIARTQGGESVNTFLRINKNLFWPDI